MVAEYKLRAGYQPITNFVFVQSKAFLIDSLVDVQLFYVVALGTTTFVLTDLIDITIAFVTLLRYSILARSLT